MRTSKDPKPKIIRVRMSETTLQDIEKIASVDNTTTSEVVRTSIKRYIQARRKKKEI